MFKGVPHDRVIEMIKNSGDSVEMTVLSSTKEVSSIRTGKIYILLLKMTNFKFILCIFWTDNLIDDTPIFAALLGTEKIDYKVEQERFLARAVRKRRGQSGDKRGTNFSNPSKPDAPVSKDGDEDSKPRRRKGGKSMLFVSKFGK